MATYNDIHSFWTALGSSFELYARINGTWRNADVPDELYVRNNGAWEDVLAFNATSPKLLLRKGGLWVARSWDVWDLSVCVSNISIATNEYTIPTAIFGLPVNKVVIDSVGSSYSTIHTKQESSAGTFRHYLTKNGLNIYTVSAQHTDGYTCNDANYSPRGTLPTGTTFQPGDKIGARVSVQDANVSGATKLKLAMKWYFN